MMIAATAPVRGVLRRARAGWRRVGAALDYRREFGFAGLAARIAAGPQRSNPAAALPETPVCGAAFDVIYAIGYWEGEPKRYRVFNIAEGLRAAGYAVHIMPFARLADIVRYRWRAAALVLFRAEYDRLAGIAETLSYARRAGMRIVYDIDDLVFDETIADRIDGLTAMGWHQRRDFVAALARRRRLLLACDLVTAATAPLARAAAVLGRPSAVIPNSLNGQQLLAADEMPCRQRAADVPLRIGYFSGTRTHQRDFAVCESALLKVMARHQGIVFRLVGHLDLGPQWNVFADRVERIGIVPPEELLRRIAETDINLAPLEIGNPFCEAKSELKFFEAAVVGVPTVAAATEPFVAAIEHGVNGFVVSDPTGWRDALEALLAGEARRTAIGVAAQARARERFSLTAVTPQAIAALGLAGA
jgi:glycosyltransferase involved in cell wall biosynthesis